MSYSYVSKKDYKPFKKEFDAILSEMQIIMRKEHKVTMEIRLVGSGANNCVTKDDSTRFWDLDYNIIIRNLPDKFAKSPDKLKEKIRLTIDRVKDSGKYLKGYNISFGKNSTLPITYKVTKNNKPIMGVDIAIIRYDKKTFSAFGI
ncbi:MAG: hypothetical protein BWZ04_02394 [Firmicutes bacterium ADurb.BinA205]|nr:MAG: hypothetical protein BWZ04_02394 [Firmicutes bacterium ADurb.BinA205]